MKKEKEKNRGKGRKKRGGKIPENSKKKGQKVSLSCEKLYLPRWSRWLGWGEGRLGFGRKESDYIGK